MSILSHYSPEDVDIYIAGVLKVKGYAKGTFVNISKDTQRFTTKESSDGVMSRSHSNSRSYSVGITLHSAASFNGVLTRLSEIDNVTKMGKFPLIIKDRLGSTLLFSPTSWIEVIPDTDFGAEILEREWMFKCSNTSLHVGGNESGSSFGEDAFNVGTGLLGGLL